MPYPMPSTSRLKLRFASESRCTGHANYVWILHMVSKLSENGVAGFVLVNGSMSTNTKGEGEIRQKLVENDLVETASKVQLKLAA